MAGPISIAVLGNVKDLVSNLGAGETSLQQFEDKAETSTSKVADGVDKAGAGFAKLQGAVGGVAGGLETVGLGGFGDQLNKVAPLLGFAAGAADIFTLANEALNLSFLMSPIGLTVIAVAALVAGFVIAYKKSETFRDIVNGVFKVIKNVVGGVVGWLTDKVPGAFHKIIDAVSSVISWVKEHWPLIVGIITGPIGLAVVEIVKHWDDVKAGASNLLHFVEGLGVRIARAGVSVVNGFISMFNGILNGWNSLDLGIHVHLPSYLGGAGFDVDDLIPDVPLIPSVPALARGGITTGPTLALIGDNPGGREAVIPLDNDNNLFGGRHYTINVHVDPTANLAEIGRKTVEAIEAFELNGGRRRAR